MVKKTRSESRKCQTSKASKHEARGMVPVVVATAICRIVDHYLHDERRAYERMPDPFRRDHIYPDLELTNEWLRWLSGRVS